MCSEVKVNISFAVLYWAGFRCGNFFEAFSSCFLVYLHMPMALCGGEIDRIRANWYSTSWNCTYIYCINLRVEIEPVTFRKKHAQCRRSTRLSFELIHDPVYIFYWNNLKTCVVKILNQQFIIYPFSIINTP